MLSNCLRPIFFKQPDGPANVTSAIATDLPKIAVAALIFSVKQLQPRHDAALCSTCNAVQCTIVHIALGENRKPAEASRA